MYVSRELARNPIFAIYIHKNVTVRSQCGRVTFVWATMRRGRWKIVNMKILTHKKGSVGGPMAREWSLIILNQVLYRVCIFQEQNNKKGTNEKLPEKQPPFVCSTHSNQHHLYIIRQTRHGDQWLPSFCYALVNIN